MEDEGSSQSFLIPSASDNDNDDSDVDEEFDFNTSNDQVN